MDFINIQVIFHHHLYSKMNILYFENSESNLTYFMVEDHIQ